MKGRRFVFWLIPAIVLAAVLAWPVWLGGQAQRQLEAYRGGPLGDIHIGHRLETFERGWLGSRATSLFRVDLGGENLEFPVRHRISHGFGPLKLDSEPVYSPDAADALATLFHGEIPLRITTILKPLSWAAVTRVHSPPFQAEMPQVQGGHIQSAGLSGTFHWQERRLYGDMDMPELHLEDADGRLRISGQTVALDLADTRSRVADGWLEYRAERLDMTLKNTGPMHLEDLRLRSAQTRDGDFLHMDLDMDLGTLRLEDREMGDAGLQLRLGPLHAPTFDRLLTTLQALNTPDAADLRADGLADAVTDDLLALLAHSPALHLDGLRLRMPEGRMELALRADFDGKDLPGDEPLLERLGLDGRLIMDKPLLETLAGEIGLRSMAGDAGMDPDMRALLSRSMGQGLVQGLVDEGHVIADEAHYRAEVALKDGRLSLNGEDRTVWLYLLMAGLFAQTGSTGDADPP